MQWLPFLFDIVNINSIRNYIEIRLQSEICESEVEKKSHVITKINSQGQFLETW